MCDDDYAICQWKATWLHFNWVSQSFFLSLCSLLNTTVYVSICIYHMTEPLQTISQRNSHNYLIGIWYQVICVINRLREELPLVMVYKTTMSTVKNHTRLIYFILYKKYLQATPDKVTLTLSKYCKQYCIIHLALSNTLAYH